MRCQLSDLDVEFDPLRQRFAVAHARADREQSLRIARHRDENSSQDDTISAVRARVLPAITDDRRDDDRDPRDNVGDGVQRFTVEKRSVCASRQCQGRERNERNEMSAPGPAPVIDGLNE